jgi:hypothetical protein
MLSPAELTLVQILVQILGFAGGLYGLYTAIQIQFTKSLSEYGEKYRSAIFSLPYDYIIGNMDRPLNSYGEEEQKKIIVTSLRLFNVMAEEYELQRNYRFIGRRIYEVWIRGDQRNMQFRMLTDCWTVLKFRFHSDFVKFMETKIINSQNHEKIDGWF